MKQLSRNTPCTSYKIKTPIWNGGAKMRTVGLAEYRMTKHNEVEFTYRRKRGSTAGELSIPDHYYFDGDTRDRYPRQRVRGGVTLVIVPFHDLETLVRTTPLHEIKDPREMPPLIAKIFFNYKKEEM